MGKNSTDIDPLKAFDELGILAVNHSCGRGLSNKGVLGFMNKDIVEVR